jgi:putative acetyltransferase
MEDLQAAVALLREASRQAARQLGFLESRYRETGCTHSQCHVLVELDARRRVTVGELAAILDQDISSTSRTIRSLIKKEFVQIFADSKDGRRRQLKLTSAGKKKVHEIHDVADMQARAALELLNPSDQAIVVRGMSLYAQALARSQKLAGIEIRPIVADDNEAMSAVIRQVMSEFGAMGNGMSIGDAEVDRMYEAYRGKQSAYFVATEGTTLLGGAGIGSLTGSSEDDICELRKMYLLPAGRGVGLGRKLMNHCLDAAREMGYRRIYLETLDNMCHARHLFEKYGFRYLEAPLGETGHYGCTTWAIRDL